MRDHHLIQAEATRKALARPLPPAGSRNGPHRSLLCRLSWPLSLVVAPRSPCRERPGYRPRSIRRSRRSAETAVRQGIARIEKARPQLAGRVQAAALGLDPNSGEIRAMVGGRRYGGKPVQSGHAGRAATGLDLQALRLSGRLRGGAPRHRLTPASLLADEPLSVRAGGDNWEPQNMDRQFHGPVTVRRALEESRNIPACASPWIWARGGWPRWLTPWASSIQLTPVPSLALGHI
jgi:hypothetical protein